MSKVNQLVQAMRDRVLINIGYADLGQVNPKGAYKGITLYRDCIPVTIGTTSKGNLALRAYDQYRGEWRLFLIAHIGRIQVTDQLFNESSYPGYSGGDKGLSVQHTLSRMPKTNRTQQKKKAARFFFN